MDNQRGKSKELFDKSGLECTPNNWHIWKRAFDLGVSEAKESDLLNRVIECDHSDTQWQIVNGQQCLCCRKCHTIVG